MHKLRRALITLIWEIRIILILKNHLFKNYNVRIEINRLWVPFLLEAMKYFLFLFSTVSTQNMALRSATNSNTQWLEKSAESGEWKCLNE